MSFYSRGQGDPFNQTNDTCDGMTIMVNVGQRTLGDKMKTLSKAAITQSVRLLYTCNNSGSMMI